MVAVPGPTTGPHGQDLPAIPASTWEILSNEKFNPRQQPERLNHFISAVQDAAQFVVCYAPLLRERPTLEAFANGEEITPTIRKDAQAAAQQWDVQNTRLYFVVQQITTLTSF